MKFKRPDITLKILDATSDKSIWSTFSRHHYLDAKLNKSSRCYIATWNNVPVAFCAILAMPSGSIKNAWRGHRLVVLPDFQGMGIGNRLSEFVGNMLINDGKKYFTKTANIKLGEYRNNSPKWRATSKNMKRRPDIANSKRKSYNNISQKHLGMRLCYSHEYIGNKTC